MTTIHRLQFLPAAKAEWDKLDGSICQQFAKVLLKRLEHPRVEAAVLSGMPDCYKIKLRSSGFRLVYQVHDDALILLTIAVGKRDKSSVYSAALERLTQRSKEAKQKSVAPTAPATLTANASSKNAPRKSGSRPNAARKTKR
jgi:mRNA interferase RelE/StbE